MNYQLGISRFNHNRILTPVLLSLLSALLFSCSSGLSSSNSFLPAKPLARQGSLDLTYWDFTKDGSIKLDGEWEMYWQQLYDPAQFVTNTLSAANYVRVPANWTTYRFASVSLPAMGYATFRLRVHLSDEAGQHTGAEFNNAHTRDKWLGFKLLEMYTAYKLWVNGELVANNGEVGTNASTVHPQFLPQVVAFQTVKPELDIVVQVANYCFSKSGISRSILLGEYSSLQRLHENDKAYNLFFTGAILMIGLYHLGLFWLGRKEKALLFFGFFCLLLMFRNLFIGERVIYEVFPAFNWFLGLKLELLPLFIGPSLFLLFIASLYPQEVKNICLLVFIILNSMGTLALAVISTLYVDFLFYINLGVLSVICLYIIYTLLKAAVRKRPGAAILVAGFFVFFLSLVNDTLYVEGLLPTNHYIGLGLVFFILAEIAINEKFVRAEEQLKVEHEKLVHADKLAALGTLVASVAHEVNNPNNVIKINIDGALEDAKTLCTLVDENITDKESLQIGALSYTAFINNFDASLQAIQKSADEIKQIVEDLKTYAKHKKDEPSVMLDFNQLIQEVIRLMAPFIKSATNRFTVNLAAYLPAFHGQPQRLKQVLVNLLQNACQALENKQQGIFIATTCQLQTRTLELVLQDEGVGMDKETQQRIFEPFFTKKQTKGGTGLGLSIARQIVVAHNGEISFDSQVGKGTTVRLVFNIPDREA